MHMTCFSCSLIHPSFFCLPSATLYLQSYRALCIIFSLLDLLIYLLDSFQVSCIPPFTLCVYVHVLQSIVLTIALPRCRPAICPLSCLLHLSLLLLRFRILLPPPPRHRLPTRRNRPSPCPSLLPLLCLLRSPPRFIPRENSLYFVCCLLR